MNPRLMTDEGLLRIGSHDELIRRYRPVITSISSTFRIHGMLVEDVRAEAWFAFSKAVRTFNHDAGVKFGTYVRRLIRNQLSDNYRHADRDSAIPIGKLVSIASSPDADDGISIEDIASEGSFEHDSVERIDTVGQSSAIWDHIECVADEILSGYVWGDIAKQLNVSESAIALLAEGLRGVAAHLFGDRDSYLEFLAPHGVGQPCLFEIGEGDRDKHDRVLLTMEHVMHEVADELSVLDIALVVGVTEDAVKMVVAGVRAVACSHPDLRQEAIDRAA